MTNRYDYLVGWTVEFREVSNGCYINRAVRYSGNRIEYDDDNFDRMEKSILDIEIEISNKNRDDKYEKYVYSYLDMKFKSNKIDIISSNYNSNENIRWIIESNTTRLSFDKRSNEYIIQKKDNNIWKIIKRYNSCNITGEISFSFYYLFANKARIVINGNYGNFSRPK